MKKLSCHEIGLAGDCVELNLITRVSHRHNEIELTILEHGSLTYLFGGKQIILQAGQLGAFWAAIPHHVLVAEPATILHWLTIPLGYVLHWQMPGTLTQRLLNGQFIIDTTGACTYCDAHTFARWKQDLSDKTHALRSVVLLESEACLRRLAYAQSLHPVPPLQSIVPDTQPVELLDVSPVSKISGAREWNRAQLASSLITQYYQHPLSVTDIANKLGIHAHSLMRLFQQTFGMSVIEYLTQYRLAQAQRLLATTDLPVLEIALSSGFSSVSRFYAAFHNAFGCSPRAYRTSLTTYQSVIAEEYATL